MLAIEMRAVRFIVVILLSLLEFSGVWKPLERREIKKGKARARVSVQIFCNKYKVVKKLYIISSIINEHFHSIC